MPDERPNSIRELPANNAVCAIRTALSDVGRRPEIRACLTELFGFLRCNTTTAPELPVEVDAERCGFVRLHGRGELPFPVLRILEHDVVDAERQFLVGD